VLPGIGVALGRVRTDRCSNADVNGNNNVTVDKVLAAISAAIHGCP